MRALLNKIVTGSMVAGAALLVAGCGGEGETEVNNLATTDLETDVLGTNDVTAVDAGTALDANLAMDANAMDMNATVDTNTTDEAATNGM